MKEMLEKLKEEVKKIKSSLGIKVFALVIDDSLFDRVLRKRHILAAGCDEVEFAENGPVGLEAVKRRLDKNEMYFIISCDYEMPGWFGAQTLAEIVKYTAEFLKQREKELQSQEKKLTRQLCTDTSSVRLKSFMDLCREQIENELNLVTRKLSLLRDTMKIWDRSILWGVTSETEQMYKDVKLRLRNTGLKQAIQKLRFTDKRGNYALMHNSASQNKKMSAPPLEEGLKDSMYDVNAINRRHSEPPVMKERVHVISHHPIPK